MGLLFFTTSQFDLSLEFLDWPESAVDVIDSVRFICSWISLHWTVMCYCLRCFSLLPVKMVAQVEFACVVCGEAVPQTLSLKHVTLIYTTYKFHLLNTYRLFILVLSYGNINKKKTKGEEEEESSGFCVAQGQMEASDTTVPLTCLFPSV